MNVRPFKIMRKSTSIRSLKKIIGLFFLVSFVVLNKRQLVKQSSQIRMNRLNNIIVTRTPTNCSCNKLYNLQKNVSGRR